MHKEEFIDYNKFYTKEEFEQFLTKKGIDNSKFNITLFKQNMEIYNKEVLNTYISTNSNGDIILLKDLVESMNWNFFKFLQKHNFKNMYKAFLQNHYEGYITIYIAANILEWDAKLIEARIEKNNNIMDLIELNGEKMVKYEDVNKWLKFKKSHIEVHEISIEIVATIEEGKRGTERFYRNKIKEMYDKGLFDKYKPILGKNTPLRTKFINSIFINRKYKDKVYELVKYELINKSFSNFGTKKDIFNLEFNKILNNDGSKNKKTTLKEFYNFTITRFSNRSSRQKPYLDILNLIDNLDKELTSYTTEEVTALLNGLPSDRAKEEFDYFLKHLKNRKTTKYGMISYNRRHTKKERKPILPYTEEQYQRFGFLVLSDSHIWYEEYMKKALKKRLYSSTWLYAVLHYVCAWRAEDIMNKLPRPNLRMEPNDFLDKVKSKRLTKEEAFDIIEQVNMRLDLWNLRPSKTKSNTTPTLVMEIPESLFEFLGTLIGITEAHYQLSSTHNKKGLINRDANRRDVQVEFFGEEFVKIFGEDSFNNLRAVKNYEMLLSRKADEKELGTGYILASIARAHKFKLDKKATTTMVYLKYYKNMEDSEVILSELFERGVCSFVPYLLTKIVAGEENVLKLSHKERTKKMNEIIGMSSYESEMLIQGYNLALERAEDKVDKIVKNAISEGLEPKKIARDILLKLIYNEASSKQGDLSCMLIAQGKPCIYKKRENCVGCGHEIYLKSCLFELGNRIEQARKEALMSKTDASRNKNILMIRDILSPIVAEIFISLKDIYKIENIDEFKRLIR